MATITSTIRLVDQMTPTLNRITNAIDRLSRSANGINGSFDRTPTAITRSANAMHRFSNSVNKASNYTRKLYYALRNVSMIIATIRSLKWMAEYADTMMNATSRLNNINDGLFTTAEYMDIIYAAAQRSRGSFSAMATQVSKLGTIAGDAFGGSVPQMVAFAELLNKTFRIAGSSASEATNATYQLTQAMAAGKLQGDEMRSIMENAPLLARKIADELGVSIGEVKKLGSEGKVTADVIKNALFNSADEIEAKFNSLPRTIGDVWTNISNAAQQAFRRVVQRIQTIINSPAFVAFENTIINIINRIADAVIWLFDLFNQPIVQSSLRKITLGLQAIWQMVSELGNLVYRVVSWMCDNWNWLGQVLYSIIAIVLLYKAVMLVVNAIVALSHIKTALAAWASALSQGAAWAWVILIVVLFVAIIYAGVAAYNYFTNSAVSATGVLFGAVAFLIVLIKGAFTVIWDLFCLIGIIFDTVAKLISVAFVDLILTVSECLTTLVDGIIELGVQISNVFLWLGEVFSTWATNVAIGMSQLCQNLPVYWEIFKLSVAQKFWSLVYNAGLAFNSLLDGARELCEKMVQPFVNFAQAVVDVLNSIIDGWNGLCEKLTMTVDTNVVTTAMGIAGKQIGLSGGKLNRLGDVRNPFSGGGGGGVNLSGAAKNLASVGQSLNAAKGKLQSINFSTNDIPAFGDYVNFGSVADKFNFSGAFDHWNKDNYTKPWNDLMSQLSNIDKIFDKSDYDDPIAAFEKWYKIGTKFENGLDGVVDFLGAFLKGIGNGIPSSGDGSTGNLPDSLQDLLDFGTDGGHNLPSVKDDSKGGGGSGASDALDNIANSTGNIEDKLDLAEEELELLRKLAEQDVINRFTTAEIHVDMTNNNNISSGMDLDGIVTHLSTKLYEELGVVASGVHY